MVLELAPTEKISILVIVVELDSLDQTVIKARIHFKFTVINFRAISPADMQLVIGH